MQYAQLRSTVEDYVENSFSDDDFAAMTRLAEQKLYNTVQLPVARKSTVLAVTQYQQYVNLPDDFLSPYSFAVIDGSGVYSYLLNKDPDFMREAFPDPAAYGTPRYYALYGAQVADETTVRAIVAPTPATSMGAELQYAAYPTSISVAGSSWLGDNFESALVNAVLVEAARFMKEEPDVIQMYENELNQSLILLKQMVDGKNRQDTYRSGQPKTKVG